jgi:hypothetical protein
LLPLTEEEAEAQRGTCARRTYMVCGLLIKLIGECGWYLQQKGFMTANPRGGKYKSSSGGSVMRVGNNWRQTV